MNFYKEQHKFYCGIDLHARKMYLCILDEKGEVKLHRNMDTDREIFLKAIEPYREDVVVAVECMFTWYWIADLCQREGISFVLGHALYMKAIHGGKAKNDKIDSQKIAVLLRGGMIPMSYVYPEKMRATRDLMRRRNHLMRKRAELLAHIQNTNSQYNLDETFGCIAVPSKRGDIVGSFDHPAVKKSVEADLKVITVYDATLHDLEKTILKLAQYHDPVSYALLDSVYGIGKIGALTILYEIEDIRRFPRVQDFVSYARLVKCEKTSAGKSYGTSGNKIGNAHLKRAFSEAALLFLRGNEPAKKWFEKLTRKHGKGKALSILAHKLGRAVYFMLKNKEAFDEKRFLR
ncbi:MAG: IS110 family transposase [Bacteroidales bacterium]|nr:IS110 family transposase [Bacteroidales bacterium]